MRVPDEDVRILYDLCIASMDFGSGFLDREEYDTLQRIAMMLGVEYPVCDEYIFWSYERRIFDVKAPRCILPKHHFGNHRPNEEALQQQLQLLQKEAKRRGIEI